MNRFSTPAGTYIFPQSVDFTTFDPSLFNVDLLIRQGLTDERSNTIPVIVTEEKGANEDGTGPLENALVGVSGYRAGVSLASVGGFSGRVEKDQAAEASKRLSDASGIGRVYLDKRVNLSLADSTKAVGAERARRQYNVSGRNVTVAVLDTGIDDTHPDLDEGTVALERDFTNEGTVADRYGHGTHVAAIIAGDGDASNGTYTGVAPNATLINARVLNSNGYGRTSWIIRGMEYSVNHSADIVSLSLGSAVERNDPLVEATNWAVDSGAVVTVAAGNDGINGYYTVGSPGVAPKAVTVGAYDDATGAVASFSSRGPTRFTNDVKPDLVAPGVGIVSARATGTSMGSPVGPEYTRASGTSMATPHVAGVAALLLDAHRNWTPTQVKTALVTTTDRLPNGHDVYTVGSGAVNATAAIDPGLRFDAANLRLGTFGENATVRRTVTVTNRGNRTRTVGVSVDATDIVTEEGGNTSLNRSRVTLAPGESQTVAVTVNTAAAGIYSGRIRFATNESTYRVLFGYVKGYDVTVEKGGVDGTTVEGDPVLLVPHDRMEQRFFGLTVRSIQNGSATFFTYGGNYTFWSVGADESTTGRGDEHGTVLTSGTIDVPASTTVVLDENETVAFDLERGSSGSRLSNLSVQTDLRREFTYANGASSTYVWGHLNEFVDTRTVRYSPDPAQDAIVEYWLVPSRFHDNTRLTGYRLDSPTVYHLSYHVNGITAPRTFVLNRSRLAVQNRTYAKEFGNETYRTSEFAISDRAGEESDIASRWRVTNRTDQTLFVTPGVDYTFDVAVSGQVPGWSYYRWRPITPGLGERFDVVVGRQPLTPERVGWRLWSDGFYVETFPQTDQGPTRTSYDNWGGEGTMEVYRNGTRITTDRVRYRARYFNDTAVQPGTTVTVRQTMSNPGHLLSTRTVSVRRATFRPGNDSTPPRIDGVRFDGTNSSNVVTGTDVTSTITVSDGGTVTNVTVLYAPGNATAPPWDAAGAWQRAPTTNVSGPQYKATLPLGTFNGTVDVAIVAQDASGNIVKTATFDAIRVRTRPEVSVRLVGDESVTPGENATFDVVVETNGAEVSAAGFDLTTSGGNVSVLSLDRGPFFRKDGGGARVLVDSVDSGGTHARYVEVRNDSVHGVTGSGVLARVTVAIPTGTDPAGTDLQLDNVSMRRSDGSTVPTVTENVTLSREPARVSIDPPNTTELEPGDTFTVDVRVDDSGFGVYAAQLNLRYNTSLLTATNVTRGPYLSQNGAGTMLLSNRIDDRNGTVMYGESRKGTLEASGDGVLATIRFRVEKDATLGKTSPLTAESVALVDANSTSIPTAVDDGRASLAPQPLPEITASTPASSTTIGVPLSVHVNATHTRNLSFLRVRYPNGTVAKTIECNGTRCGGRVRAVFGNDSWNGTGYEPVRLLVSAVDEEGAIARTTVRVRVRIRGDVNGDGTVDIADAVGIGRSWKAKRGQPSYSASADLNNDGVVDIFDAIRVGRQWNETVTMSGL